MGEINCSEFFLPVQNQQMSSSFSLKVKKSPSPHRPGYSKSALKLQHESLKRTDSKQKQDKSMNADCNDNSGFGDSITDDVLLNFMLEDSWDDVVPDQPTSNKCESSYCKPPAKPAVNKPQQNKMNTKSKTNVSSSTSQFPKNTSSGSLQSVNAQQSSSVYSHRNNPLPTSNKSSNQWQTNKLQRNPFQNEGTTAFQNSKAAVPSSRTAASSKPYHPGLRSSASATRNITSNEDSSWKHNHSKPTHYATANSTMSLKEVECKNAFSTKAATNKGSNAKDFKHVQVTKITAEQDSFFSDDDDLLEAFDLFQQSQQSQPKNNGQQSKPETQGLYSFYTSSHFLQYGRNVCFT